MKRFVKILLALTLASALIAGTVLLLKDVNIAVLNPQGEIARKEYDLLIFTLALSLVVVVPVFAMLIGISLRYREGNKRAIYRPEWDGSRLLEAIWWGIPCVIIIILGVITWQSSHDLDPYKDLDSPVAPVNVQVVSLQWKWLFIYPDQNIATVNELVIPEKTPINFTITSDAPMNSFWIPSLGGQVYAMSGMSTELKLIADTTGEYRGSSANISGTGFADMNFTVKSQSKTDFDAWVKTTAEQSSVLDDATYSSLVEPGIQKQPIYYALKDNGLYDKIIMKYMMPPVKNEDSLETNHDAHMEDMN